MGKVNEYAQGRSDGMLLSLKLVKEGGIEALEKEIKFRNVTGVNVGVTSKELDKAAEQIKIQTTNTVCLLVISVLHDRFGFGPKRCQEFWKWFNNRADCILANMATWDDWYKTIKKELKIDIPIHNNDGTAKERREHERKTNSRYKNRH